MALGEMAVVTQEERDAFYRTCEYNPAETNSVMGMPRVQWIFQANLKKPFKKVLDLCCNDGFSTRFLLNGPHIERLLGIDLNEPAIEGANKFLKTVVFPEYAEYRNESIFDSEITETFDTVICFETLEHFLEPDAKKLLQLVHDRLEEGGSAYMSTPHVDGCWGKTNPDPTHIFLVSPEEVMALMDEVLGIEPVMRIWGDIIHWTWTKASPT